MHTFVCECGEVSNSGHGWQIEGAFGPGGSLMMYMACPDCRDPEGTLVCSACNQVVSESEAEDWVVTEFSVYGYPERVTHCPACHERYGR